MVINRLQLIKDFKEMLPCKINDKIDKIVSDRRNRAISFLESLTVETLSEKEIDKAFDLDAGRINDYGNIVSNSIIKYQTIDLIRYALNNLKEEYEKTWGKGSYKSIEVSIAKEDFKKCIEELEKKGLYISNEPAPF